jgi:HK97 family phage portal protein
VSYIADLLWPKRTIVAEERRSLSLTDYDQWLELGLAGGTESGVSVTSDSALRVSSVYSCVRILAETVAMLPLITYERLARGKRRASEHPLYALLHDRPNDFMTAYTFRETVQGHLALRGNAYIHVDYDGAGRVEELFPLRPDRLIQIVERDGRLMYQYQLPEAIRWFTDAEIWHLRSLGADGRIGYSPVSLHRQGVGLAMAQEIYSARFFGKGATPGGVLEHPGQLSDQARTNLRESWEGTHGGLGRSHKVAILEEGLKWSAIGMSNLDAQYIEGRKFQVTEIARMFRIPPHMVGDLERATFSNIEHQGLEFVIYTMMPWLVNWEQSILQTLFLPADRQRFFPEFLLSGLLRGDTEVRYAAYAVARQNGWLSANDIRELENMNPVEGGDTYLVPLNLIPVRSLEPAPRDPLRVSADTLRRAEDRAARSVETRKRLRSAYHELFRDTAGRVVRRETARIREKAAALLAARNAAELSLWLDGFYEDHREFIHDRMSPVFRSYGEAVAAEAADEIGVEPLGADALDRLARAYVEDFAAHHIGISLSEIRNLLQRAAQEGTDPLVALQVLMDEWEESRPEAIAGIETVRSGNAMAIGLYLAAGVTILRWHAFGKSCPYCIRLDGRQVGIHQHFIGAGEAFAPDGDGEPLTPKHEVRHPPAHKGCDCMILAGS